MAALRTVVLRWDITTGKVKLNTCYLKREERIDVDLYVTDGGDAYELPAGWGLNLTLKPEGEGDADALLAITSWSSSATTGLYQATSQAVSSIELDAYLEVNADSSDDVASQYVDVDVYYAVAGAMKAKSDTVTMTLKPDVGRTDDGTAIAAALIGFGSFQRNLQEDLTLADGQCLVLHEYLNDNGHTITLLGDADINILN